MTRPRIGTKVSLNQGIHNKENSGDAPLGSLKYARNSEYRGLSNGLARRRGMSDLATAIANIPGHGITQFQQIKSNGVSKLVVCGGDAIYAGDVDETNITLTDLTASADIFSDAGPATMAFYDDRIYISNGDADPVMYDGSMFRKAGIPNDKTIGMSVSGSAGSAITVDLGYHFTYRFYDSNTGAFSDIAVTERGDPLYVSLAVGSYDIITVSGLPVAAPGFTGATHVILMMSDDEADPPSTFYPHKWIKITSAMNGETFPGSSSLNDIQQPTLHSPAVEGGVTFGASAGESAFDESVETFASLRASGLASSHTTVSSDWLNFPSKVTTHQLQVIISSGEGTYHSSTDAFGDTYDDTVLFEILYSVDGGVTFPYTLWSSTAEWFNVKPEVGSWTGGPPDDMTTYTATTGLVGVDSANIHVRVRTVHTNVGTGYTQGPAIRVHDIRVFDAAASDGQIAFADVPTTEESNFVNAFNIGQFQPPPKRIFPTTFDGHLLGRSDSNGLWLAYTRADQPEHWSTNPNFALFPNLIPFKEKEADDIVGAERAGIYLVVLAGDSIWRIESLPVISNPEGSNVNTFENARLSAKERVTDTVGCVGELAYARVQLAADHDLLFFWSRIGPMLTDGFRVWQAADHVDWSFLNDDLSKTAITNDTQNRRLLVSLRTEDATVNDVVYVFHYDQGHIIRGQFGIRFKVTGPWDMNIADMTELRLSSGRKILASISSDTSGGEAGQIYKMDTGSTDSGTGTVPRFHFTTNEIGVRGSELYIHDVIPNVQEDGKTSYAIGQSSSTPQRTINKDPIAINQRGHSIVIDWDDDVITAKIIVEDGEEVEPIEERRTVEFTTSERIINSLVIGANDPLIVKD